MRWFKHYSDNYRGRSVQSFHRNFGHTGIAWYYLLTEICTEKLEKSKHRDVTIDDCEFRFDKTFIESSLRGTFAKIERWLGHGAVMGLWEFTVTEFELRVKYPILLELLDSDHLKTRSRREQDATRSLPDREEDKDKDKEVEEEKRAEISKADSPPTELCIFNDPFVQEFTHKVSAKAQKAWVELYGDKDWISEELKRAVAWMAENPQRKPKSDFSRFFGGWLKRGWEYKRKSIQPAQRSNFTQFNQPRPIKYQDASEIFAQLELQRKAESRQMTDSEREEVNRKLKSLIGKTLKPIDNQGGT